MIVTRFRLAKWNSPLLWRFFLVAILFCYAHCYPAVSGYVDWDSATPSDLCNLPINTPKLVYLPDTTKCLTKFLDTYCSTFVRIDVSGYSNKESLWNLISLNQDSPLILYNAHPSALGGFGIEWKQCFDPKHKSFAISTSGTAKSKVVDCTRLVLIVTANQQLSNAGWKTFLRTFAPISPSFDSLKYAMDCINHTMRTEFKEHEISRVVFSKFEIRLLSAWSSFADAKLPVYTCELHSHEKIESEMKKVSLALQRSVRARANECRRYIATLNIPIGEELNSHQWSVLKPLFLSAAQFLSLSLSFIALFMVFKISERWKLRRPRTKRKPNPPKTAAPKTLLLVPEQQRDEGTVEPNLNTQHENCSTPILEPSPLTDGESEVTVSTQEINITRINTRKKRREGQSLTPDKAHSESESDSSYDEVEQQPDRPPKVRSVLLPLVAHLISWPVGFVFLLLQPIVWIVSQMWILGLFFLLYGSYFVHQIVEWNADYFWTLHPDEGWSAMFAYVFSNLWNMIGSVLFGSLAGAIKGLLSEPFRLLNFVWKYVSK